MKDPGKHAEGVTVTTNDDGSQHVTVWYDNGYGSSTRSSTDYDSEGNASNEHTTVQSTPDNDE